MNRRGWEGILPIHTADVYPSRAPRTEGCALYRRVNITLPEETLELLDRATQGRNRSRLIDRAVRHYLETFGRAKLREKLKEGYLRRAERSRALAAEWFSLEEEAWSARRR